MANRLTREIDSCNFEASNDDKDIMLAQYGSHQRNHELTARYSTNPTRLESFPTLKTERTKISSGSSEESWNNYKRKSGIHNSIITGELFECCDIQLGDDIKQNSTLLEGTEQNLLAVMKNLAVIPVAVCVCRSELLQMRQDHSAFLLHENQR